VLIYPCEWYGELEATIEHGEIQFDATQVKDFERGNGYIKATRGNGQSRMEVHVGTGNLDILVGL
jgi:hypothetical protein